MICKIVPLEARWLDDVWRIEQSAHHFPWAESMIRQAPNKIAFNYVMLSGETVIGYFYAQCVAGEATLLNIAIDPRYQGQGYGKRLLQGFLEQSQQRQAEEAWLEVRESNQAAYKLYESIGFNEINRRTNYYPTANGREDALIMTYPFISFDVG